MALAACGVLALVSVALQGFQFGVDNNLFHIPIVLRWYDLPQFADDAFVQSLRRYATPVFPALSLVATEHDIRTVFLVCHLLTRAISFYALLQLLRSFGLGAGQAAGALVALALSSALYGLSAVGKDELFTSIFTHTALAQAIALLAIAWLIRGEMIKAALAAAVAFDINVMVGAWTLAPIALVCLPQLIAAPRAQAPRLARAALVFALVAAPVVAWVITTQTAAPVRFDYHAYLADYFPYHFFIGWARWPERLTLALQVLAGLGAAVLLPRNRAAAALALLGLVLLFLAGVVVDQVSSSRLVLNLHLLRADGMMLWVCAVLVAGAA
ncbi:MAG: hypothetical protein JWQ97_1176, partial [Phenylobacterium sp.]|nr:hypothetical protein [Phenylobacterium sp.]